MSVVGEGGGEAFDGLAAAGPGAPAAFARVVRRAAERWEGTPLVIRTPAGQEIRLGAGAAAADLPVRLEIRDFRFVRRVLLAGDLGFAEGFVAGDWDTPDISALLTAFSANFDRLERLMRGHPLVRGASFLSHLLRANSRRGARRNIHAHYDLGNAFYQLWLDPSLTYSAALFADPQADLEAAQRAKNAALLDALEVGPGESLLEIGCGWGGFALAAAARGARVTALTISEEQWREARRRVFEAGLAERVDVRLQDYRDLEGRFDKIASIEMFEAVGEAYWPSYFDVLARALAPGGRAGLQVITIAEGLFEGYRRRPDFIQAYVFPGGMLPSEPRLRAETDRAGLRWTGARRFGQDYARTLAMWSDRFEAAWPEIERLGFDGRFRRLWRYYLAYCEAGFRTGRTDVLQLTLAAG